LSPKTILARETSVDGVKTWHESRSGSIAGNQKLILDQRTECMALSLRCEDDLEALRKQLIEVEAEQNRLCENDDFDEAERLDSTLQELRSKEAKECEQVRAAAQKAEALTESLLRYARERQDLAEMALDKVKALQVECEEDSKFKDDDNRRKLEDEEQELDNLRATTKRLRENVERDSASFLEDKEQVDKQIGEQTADQVEERDKASEQLAAVDEVIKQLQEELQRKLDERIKLSQAIGSCEEKIQVVSSKFEKQLRRVDNKRLKLDESQKKLEQGEQKATDMAEELALKREVFQSDCENRRRQARDVHREARRLKGVRRFTLRNVNMRNRWQKLLDPHQEERNKARKAAESTKGECNKLMESCASLEAEADVQRSHREQTLLQITSLEAAKLQAAQAKSFKEAGRLKDEIARHTDKSKELEEALTRVESSLADARRQLGEAREAEEAAQAELQRVESQCSVEELRVVRRQLRDLEKLRARPTAPASDAALFDQEIKVLRQSQEHLAQKCGIEDPESLELIESGEEDPTDDDERADEADKEELAAREQEAMQMGSSRSLGGGGEEGGETPMESEACPPSPPPEEAAEAEEEDEAEAEAEAWPSPLAAAEAEDRSPAVASSAAPADEAREVSRSTSAAEVGATGTAEDLNRLHEERDELLNKCREFEALEVSLQQGVDEAVEQDDFDKAEELETEREAAVAKLREARVALEELETEREAAVAKLREARVALEADARAVGVVPVLTGWAARLRQQFR